MLVLTLPELLQCARSATLLNIERQVMQTDRLCGAKLTRPFTCRSLGWSRRLPFPATLTYNRPSTASSQPPAHTPPSPCANKPSYFHL